jgi:hypothetical protein
MREDGGGLLTASVQGNRWKRGDERGRDARAASMFNDCLEVRKELPCTNAF